ncbi:nicotinate-nucleotide pyrophosphorylase [carboxylating] [Bryocella elongata]|uniref:Probable nicotinate-nucleotide pyrophosphorylase [carboxylating] n=1 Tax=Bryocella elongata TaxID=863522 RepID=A0A1H5ZCH8_9BACT|nr:carboxylating nicotinate-nucleotide diphosphorylase [Bryocella elongata]SEG33347.1 nicotinate-nucleotide pyrophosphorylase [carboxylating] [Bryocella elongata]
MRPDPAAIEALVRMALSEDAPWGDITAQTLIPVDARTTAKLVAREDGVLCGEDLFSTAMRLTGGVATTFQLHDGSTFNRGALIATIEGSARAILTAERVALNFTQRLSGIATLTARYVHEVAHTTARIVDTRKTTPGLRLIERYAVRCGGAHNHRFSLSDALMAKDNHLAILTSNGERSLTESLREGFATLPHTTHKEVEVDRIDQIESVLAAGADTVMLDNFSLEDMRAGVALIRERAPQVLIEASGNVSLDTVRAIAETGVDVISVGALTHSVRALDLGLDIDA